LPNQGNQCFSLEDNCIALLDSDIHFSNNDIHVTKLKANTKPTRNPANNFVYQEINANFYRYKIEDLLLAESVRMEGHKIFALQLSASSAISSIRVIPDREELASVIFRRYRHHVMANSNAS